MPPEDWKLHNLKKQIKTLAHIPKGTSITTILEDIWECKKGGTRYYGDTARNRSGRKADITIQSVKAQIIADCLESGQSQRQALEIVNIHRTENQQPKVSKSIVQRIVNEMEPEICTIVRKKQGSKDPNSKWSRARMNWVTHLIV